MIERQSHFVVIGLNTIVVPETKHPSYHHGHVLSFPKVLEMAVGAEEQGWYHTLRVLLRPSISTPKLHLTWLRTATGGQEPLTPPRYHLSQRRAPAEQARKVESFDSFQTLGNIATVSYYISLRPTDSPSFHGPMIGCRLQQDNGSSG